MTATALADFRIGAGDAHAGRRRRGGTYSGSAFGASATVAGVSGPAGASLEGVSPSLSYYIGTYSAAVQLTGLSPLSGAPIAAGAYTVLASFPGSADYAAASSLANLRHRPGDPVGERRRCGRHV